jgi:lipopolysaccharide/colanic/teichoic acid biosynthesis glycosyltransferase
MIKRIFDITFSTIGLLLLTPFFLIIIIWIKLLMPGPVFFIQQRVGLLGNCFKLIKFRTMLLSDTKTISGFDAGDSSRITPFGKFLRKTKLDEIPQLINVLKGDMSFVGPRPEVKQWTEVYPEKWKIVHTVRPGITDNASIVFRNEEEILSKSMNPEETYRNEILPQKLDLYIDYVNNHTFRGDIMIILRTLKAIIFK